MLSGSRVLLSAPEKRRMGMPFRFWMLAGVTRDCARGSLVVTAPMEPWSMRRCRRFMFMPPKKCERLWWVAALRLEWFQSLLGGEVLLV